MCAVFSGLPKVPEAGNSWLTLIILRYRIPLVRASSELSVEWRPKRTTSTGRTERKPHSKEDLQEAKARDRARIPVTLPVPFTSPGPGTSARPASLPSPTRPAPQSQSLFRSYGSNLPTSLTYISLSTRDPFPLKTCCGYGYGALRLPNPISLLEVSKDLERLYRKENFPDLPTAFPGHFGLPR
ncbi:hypothetical protein M0802_010642 [Mischocyttarus mexicanus]|nr:hypothetical protein M0802_010642 [Mischocyttarus mexicanus]